MFELNKKDVEKSKKEFEKLLDGYFSEKRNISEGKVTKGKVVALEKGFVIVDVAPSWPTKPAACHVVPDVSWSLSSKTTSFQPNLARW